MNQNEVRFCLSNGQQWMLCDVKKDVNEDEWPCYESAVINLTAAKASGGTIFRLLFKFLQFGAQILLTHFLTISPVPCHL